MDLLDIKGTITGQFTTMDSTAIEPSSLELDVDALVQSADPAHPANLICELCRKFYTLGWVRASFSEHDKML